MKSEWAFSVYKIRQHHEGVISEREIAGIEMCGFGIHETEYGWNITHLKSGWATFMSRTVEGAKIIALHLIENYDADFERLNISGCVVENFQTLAARIETDTELWSLRRIFAIPQHELNRRGMETQPKIQIVS